MKVKRSKISFPAVSEAVTDENCRDYRQKKKMHLNKDYSLNIGNAILEPKSNEKSKFFNKDLENIYDIENIYDKEIIYRKCL